MEAGRPVVGTGPGMDHRDVIPVDAILPATPELVSDGGRRQTSAPSSDGSRTSSSTSPISSGRSRSTRRCRRCDARPPSTCPSRTSLRSRSMRRGVRLRGAVLDDQTGGDPVAVHLVQWLSPAPIGAPMSTFLGHGYVKLAIAYPDATAKRAQSGRRRCRAHQRGDGAELPERRRSDGVIISFLQADGSPTERLYHTCLSTISVEETTEFYRDVIGLDHWMRATVPSPVPASQGPGPDVAQFDSNFFRAFGDRRFQLDCSKSLLVDAPEPSTPPANQVGSRGRHRSRGRRRVPRSLSGRVRGAPVRAARRRRDVAKRRPDRRPARLLPHRSERTPARALRTVLASLRRTAARRIVTITAHGCVCVTSAPPSPVLRLVEADLAAARKPDLRDRTPTRFLDDRASNTLRVEPLHLGREVVAHQVQLRRRSVRRMHGQLRGREAEDEPTAASIDMLEAEHVAQERPIGVGITTEQDDVRAVDHSHRMPRERGLRADIPAGPGARGPADPARTSPRNAAQALALWSSSTSMCASSASSTAYSASSIAAYTYWIANSASSSAESAAR